MESSTWGLSETILYDPAWKQPDKIIDLLCSEQGLNLVEGIGLVLKAFFNYRKVILGPFLPCLCFFGDLFSSYIFRAVLLRAFVGVGLLLMV